MKYLKIPLTQKEINAIQFYTGIEHMNINLIADMNPERFDNLKRVLKRLDFNQEVLEKLIEKFVDIYAAIYKQGNKEAITVYKGTNEQEAKLRKGEQIGKFLSTTDDEQIAKRFGDCTIIFYKEKGIPYYSPEKIKEEEGKEREEEILLLPFSKVKESRFYSKWENRDYYTITIEKENLPELSIDEIEDLKKQCLEQWEEFQEQTRQLYYLRKKTEELEEERKTTFGHKKIKDICEEEQRLFEESETIKEKLKEYNEKFTMMLKGMCRQKEIEIDKNREEIVESEKQEQERKLQEQTENTKRAIQNLIEDMEECLDSNMDTLKKKVEYYQEKAKRLGIAYTQTIETSLLEKVELVKVGLEKKKMEELEYGQLLEEKEKLEKIEQNLKNVLPIMVSNQENQSLQEIRFNLNVEVTNKLANIKTEALYKQREEILAKTPSILQRMLGGNSIQKEELKNVDKRIEFVEKDRQTRNPENTIEDILKNIYETAYEYLDGQFTPEMLEIVSKIRENFKQLPEQQELEENARKRLANRYPVESKQSKWKTIFFKKQRILTLQNQTKLIERDIKQKETYKKRKEPAKISIMTKIEEKMLKLLRELQNTEQSEEREKEDKDLENA